MSKKLLHIPDAVMEALQLVASAGGVGIEDVIVVAARVFACQEESLRTHFLRAVWCNEPVRPEKPPRPTIPEKLYALVRRVFPGPSKKTPSR